MFAANPKKEFILSFSQHDVKKAVNTLISKEPSQYVLISDDSVLNQIRIHKKGSLLDVGYHIDFGFNKINDTETKVIIEVSRKIGAINTADEVSVSNTILKDAADKFSAYLSGNIDPTTGIANIPKNPGCVVFLIIGAASLLAYIIT